LNDFFITYVSKIARYAVPFVKNIELILHKQETKTFITPRKSMVRTDVDSDGEPVGCRK
jgi:hypothetical protein